MEIIRGERDFDSKASALKFVSQYNQYVSQSTRCKAVCWKIQGKEAKFRIR